MPVHCDLDGDDLPDYSVFRVVEGEKKQKVLFLAYLYTVTRDHTASAMHAVEL